MNRRHFLYQSTLLGTIPILGAGISKGKTVGLKAPRLKMGDTVGLVSPASITYERNDLDVVEEAMATLGLKTKRAPHLLDRWGYFAGKDEERAADINQMFADPEVQAIFPMTGGWGSARLLPFLDYEQIREHPKVFMGFSDITALLMGLYAKTGLICFHGPNANRSVWNDFTVKWVKELLFDAQSSSFENPQRGGVLATYDDRTFPVTGGTATGKLVGGNLTVLSALTGSPYLPDFKGHILFLEDIGEDIYRVDRMLTTLKLAGVFEGLSGVVFGKCTRCNPDGDYTSFTLTEVLELHFRPLGIPAFQGAMIGHIEDKFTLPIGAMAKIDADNGTITLLESAVR